MDDTQFIFKPTKMKPEEVAQVVLFVKQHVKANRNRKAYTVVAKFRRMVEMELFGKVRHVFRRQLTEIIAQVMYAMRIKQVNRFPKNKNPGKGRICWRGFATPSLPNLPVVKQPNNPGRRGPRG
jgi:hypothetical protein